VKGRKEQKKKSGARAQFNEAGDVLKSREKRGSDSQGGVGSPEMPTRSSKGGDSLFRKGAIHYRGEKIPLTV